MQGVYFASQFQCVTIMIGISWSRILKQGAMFCSQEADREMNVCVHITLSLLYNPGYQIKECYHQSLRCYLTSIDVTRSISSRVVQSFPEGIFQFILGFILLIMKSRENKLLLVTYGNSKKSPIKNMFERSLFRLQN